MAYRYQSKGQLNALQHVDPLVQTIQFGVIISKRQRHKECGCNGEGSSDGDALPLDHIQVQETAHDELAAVGAGHGAGLSGCQQT